MDTYSDFLNKYPEYETTQHIDRLRADDYRRIDQAGHVYLDYTGAGLYAESQVLRHQQILNFLREVFFMLIFASQEL